MVQNPQESKEFNSWKEFADFCNSTSLENKTEVRGCESRGYNNQGYYFYKQ